jgi:hypothetical protein
MSIVAVLEIALRPDDAVRALSILEGELDVTRTFVGCESVAIRSFRASEKPSPMAGLFASPPTITSFREHG